MLVLGFSLGDYVKIGDSFIQVVSNKHGKLKIGIVAPEDVRIYRKATLPEGTVVPKEIRDTEAEIKGVWEASTCN